MNKYSLALGCCFLRATAFAQTPEGPVDYFAEASAIAEFCDKYVIDMTIVNTMLADVGIADMNQDPNAKAHFNTRFESAWWASKGLGQKSCLAGEVFYGPEGSKYPALLKSQ